MKLVLQRIRGASTGGTPTGLHGTDIVSVKAQPGDQHARRPAQLNTVTATTELAFDVTVEDSGDAQEVGIDVTLTIDQGSRQADRQDRRQIAVINPGEQRDRDLRRTSATCRSRGRRR